MLKFTIVLLGFSNSLGKISEDSAILNNKTSLLCNLSS